MSSDTTVNPSTQTNSSSAVTSATKSILGKDDFLKLLIAQLTNQDPTSPMDTSQFMSQMTEFTTLEQTQNMSDAIDKLVESQKHQELAQEAAMIGKQIQWTETTTNDDGTEQSTSYTDVVQAVNLKDGSVHYQTKEGHEVDPATITEVKTTDGTEQGG